MPARVASDHSPGQKRLVPVVEEPVQRTTMVWLQLRNQFHISAFAKPEIYEALEERGVKYAIRIPAMRTWSETSRNC